MAVNLEGRQSHHFGVAFLLTPAPSLRKKNSLEFERLLCKEQLEFDNRTATRSELALTRNEGLPLRVRVRHQPPAFGQLTITAPIPNRMLDLFIREAEAVCKAFINTWPAQRQVISRNCTIRCLFPTTTHAFQHLWETRLGQTQDDLKLLGRPVLGGGLRFFMPPTTADDIPTQVELKVESFLKDTRLLFVETQITWPQPMELGAAMDPGDRLREVEAYIKEKVIGFIADGGS